MRRISVLAVRTLGTRTLRLPIVQSRSYSMMRPANIQTPLCVPKGTTYTSEYDTSLARARPGDDPAYYTPTGIDISTLAALVSHVLSINDDPVITRGLGGACNLIYEVHYPRQKRTVAARIPLRNARDVSRTEPAVATMSYARHVLGLPVPEVFAWHGYSDNPLGAPFILQEYFEDCRQAFLDQWSPPELIPVLAHYHACLAKPLPAHLHGVGQLGFSEHAKDPSDPMSYVLRPLSYRGRFYWGMSESAAGTFKTSSMSLREIWPQKWESEFLRVLDDSPDGLNHCVWGIEEASLKGFDSTAFKQAAQDVRIFYEAALDYAAARPEHMTPCLVNRDYALRNVLVDETTLKIRAFIDWDDVYVMPLAIGVRFPEDYANGSYNYNPDSYFMREGQFREFPQDLFVDGDLDPTVTEPQVFDHVRETKARIQYRAALERFDHRFADSGLWETSRRVLKSHILLDNSDSWRWRRDWLRREAKAILTARGDAGVSK